MRAACAVDEVAVEAWRREASHHAGHRNFRPHLRARGANLMGLRGEQAFAEEFGCELDLAARPGGDGGRDLEIEIGGMRFPVDCKAAVKPRDLIVEAVRCRAGTIYVLCRYDVVADRCRLLGWQWGLVLLRSPPRDYGYGVVNHWCARRALRPIEDIHRVRAAFG